MAGAQDESLAHIYANALLDLAFQKGVHGEVLAELREFGRVLEQEASFRSFLNTPNIRQEAKKEVVQKVFGGRVSDTTLHFLLIVIDKRRQVHLPQIVTAFVEGYHERMGELVVGITSATALDDGQRQRLTQVLSQKYGKDVILRESVSAALLGGLVIQVGDSRIDGSLRTRLSSIGTRLEAARLVSEDYYED
ncbi:MAG: ATP synthase F1 subunit delta [Planctomycetota bacterium]